MKGTEKSDMKWYALYVNVRHEKIVSAKLNERGLISYVPLVKTVREWSDRKKQVEFPLISGYVFVKLNEQDFDKPRFTQGVVNYVTFQGKPAVVRETEIEGLKFFVESGYLLENSEGSDLQVGDKVRFSLSEFRDFNARVESLIGDEFAIVTFDAVSMNFRIKAPLKALKKGQAASNSNNTK